MVISGSSLEKYSIRKPNVGDVIMVIDHRSGMAYTGEYVSEDVLRKVGDTVSLKNNQTDIEYVVLRHNVDLEEMKNACVGCPFYDVDNGICTSNARSNCKYQ